MKASKSVKIIELNAQYRILSEIESEFGYYTTHKVAMFVQRKMVEILNQLAQLKQQEQ